MWLICFKPDQMKALQKLIIVLFHVAHWVMTVINHFKSEQTQGTGSEHNSTAFFPLTQGLLSQCRQLVEGLKHLKEISYEALSRQACWTPFCRCPFCYPSRKQFHAVPADGNPIWLSNSCRNRAAQQPKAAAFLSQQSGRSIREVLCHCSQISEGSQRLKRTSGCFRL